MKILYDVRAHCGIKEFHFGPDASRVLAEPDLVVCAHGSACLPNSSGYLDVLIDVRAQLFEVLGVSVLSIYHVPLGLVCVHLHVQLGHDAWEVLSDVLGMASGASAIWGARSGDDLARWPLVDKRCVGVVCVLDAHVSGFLSGGEALVACPHDEFEVHKEEAWR
jgi:hypothetical protein